jgi:phosphoenolpyruvate carboxykinase (GTP)
MTPEDLVELFKIQPDRWLAECDLTAEYFAKFGDHVPAQLREELSALRHRLLDA